MIPIVQISAMLSAKINEKNKTGVEAKNIISEIIIAFDSVETFVITCPRVQKYYITTTLIISMTSKALLVLGIIYYRR